MTGGDVSRREFLRWSGVAGLTLAGGLEFACTNSADVARSTVRQPNVLVIMCDDMRRDLLQFMPQTVEHFSAGREFSSCRLNVALCQPARCGFLTGQWALRDGNGVYRNTGYVRDGADTIAPWMSAAGYGCAVIGKYPHLLGGTRLPGWQFQRTLINANDQAPYGYRVFDGTSVSQPTDHQTDYLAAQVRAFIGSAVRPWFCWMTPTDPHVGRQLELAPRPEDADAWSDVTFDLPSYPDMSTKPSWMRALPELSRGDRARVQEAARGQLRELNAVDDAVASIFGTLKDEDQLDDTVVMFTSDNGVMYGEQRLGAHAPTVKNVPYEPAMHVPLLVRGPGFTNGASRTPVCGQDLTATCVALAEASPSLRLDGVDLRTVVSDPDAFDDRVLLHERRDPDPTDESMPSGHGVTTETRKLWRHEVEDPTDRFELYLLDEDPDEFINVANDPDYLDERNELEAELEALLAS